MHLDTKKLHIFIMVVSTISKMSHSNWNPGSFEKLNKYSLKDMPIVNPYKFDFVHRSTPCTPSQKILIVVHTSTKDAYRNRRMLLRNTWLHSSLLRKKLGLNVKIVFFTGMAHSRREQLRIEYENEMYGDIVQSTFKDTYAHNTYKLMSYLLWTSKFCSNASLLMKLDDDVLVKDSKLSSLAKKIQRWISHHNSLYIGVPISDSSPNRNPESKWFVSEDVWPHKEYPTWFQGLIYFLSPRHAIDLFRTALRTKYMHTDDVYMGILVNRTASMQGALIPDTELSYFTQDDKGIVEILKPYWISEDDERIFYHMPSIQFFTEWYYEELYRKTTPWFQW